MKRDLTIATVAILATLAICYGVAMAIPPQPPGPSPVTTTKATAAAPQPVAGKVVIRVNGEAVTENEFQAAFEQLPDEMKRQVLSPQGRQAFAEQLVRMKLLEQEGRKLGVEKDPRVAALLAAERTNVLASAAADKLVAAPSSEAVKKFYDENKNKFEAIDVSHIVVAYEGGSIPPRGGGKPLSEGQALERAKAIVQRLKAGADFAQVAKQVSDDPSSVDRGGQIGSFNRGMLPPEIETRVFTLQPGQISGPIPSKFGVHIFRVNGRTTTPLPDVSATISRHVKQQDTLDRVEALRKAAKVELDPTFFPQPKQPPPAVISPRKQPS